jgi:hypothetical protein
MIKAFKEISLRVLHERNIYVMMASVAEEAFNTAREFNL